MDPATITAAFVVQAETTAKAKRDVGRNPVVVEDEQVSPEAARD